MQRVTLDIPAADIESGERFVVLGNVDAAGRATVELNTAKPITGPQAVPVVPLDGEAPVDYVRTVVSPALYFGVYRFVVRSQDALGNVSPDADREYRVTVNSGPRPVSNVRHASVSGGRPVFAFTPPAVFSSER